MYRVSLASFFVWSLFGLAGCAAVSGLESIQENPCPFPFGCDGSAGDDGSADSTVSIEDTGTADTRSSADTAAGEAAADGASDAKGDDGSAHEVDSGHVDASDDAPSSDTGSETSDAHDGAPPSSDAEAGTHDAGHDGAGADSGCGPLDTVTNCGACGVSCPAEGDTAGISTAICTGTTCQYTCNTGYLDCNASAAPDPDGCECAWSGAITPVCCSGGACPSAHVTGYPMAMQPSGASETFYDCETSVDAQLAMDACTAYAGNAADCAMGTCNAAGELVVCNFNVPTQDSVCWAYAGAAAGYAVDVGTQLWSCPVGGATGEVKYH